MNALIKKFLKKYELQLVMLVIFMLFLVFNFSFPKLMNDDIGYLNFLKEYGYVNGGVIHYKTWSSRVFLEAVLMFMTKHFFLWKIANSLVMLGTIVIIAKYSFGKVSPKSIILIFSLYSMVPLSLMTSAGWVATTVNYHWPAFFALIAFMPFYQRLTNNDIKIWQYIISLIALFLAANQEQVNACFFTFSVLISGYLLVAKKFNVSLLLLDLISLFSLGFTLLSPGNAARTSQEIIGRFPEFKTYSFLHKFDLGFSSAGKPIFFDFNILFFIFFLLIFILVLVKNENFYVRVFSMIPLILNVLIFIGKNTFPGFTNVWGNNAGLILDNQKFEALFSETGTGLSLSYPKTWIPSLLILFLIICITIGIFTAINDKMTSFIISLLFLMAVASRVIMGFTPTVWASDMRVFYVLYILFALMAGMVLNELKKEIAYLKYEKIFSIVTTIGICTFIIQITNFIGH